MLMPGRKFNVGGYRYGYNGKWDDEGIKGIGCTLNFGNRIYDSRLGRWLSVEPKFIKYPELSPFCYVANSPIKFIDYDGKDFGVEIVDNTIIIKIDVYTINQKTTTEAEKAAAELENLKSTVVIEGITYQVKFEVHIENKGNLQSAKDAANKDDIGNVYEGSVEKRVLQLDNNGAYSGTGGVTLYGYDTKMYTLAYADDPEKEYDMGSYPEVVSHEFLHWMGLDDKGGDYFPEKGRMEYVGTRQNNYNMNDISPDDIKKVLEYACQFGRVARLKENDKEKTRFKAASPIFLTGAEILQFKTPSDVKIEKEKADEKK